VPDDPSQELHVAAVTETMMPTAVQERAHSHRGYQILENSLNQRFQYEEALGKMQQRRSHAEAVKSQRHSAITQKTDTQVAAHLKKKRESRMQRQAEAMDASMHSPGKTLPSSDRRIVIFCHKCGAPRQLKEQDSRSNAVIKSILLARDSFQCDALQNTTYASKCFQGLESETIWVEGQPLNLMEMFTKVQENGGFTIVNEMNKWSHLCCLWHIESECGARVLRETYCHWLLKMDRKYATMHGFHQIRRKSTNSS
jgi:hypothetical protein